MSCPILVVELWGMLLMGIGGLYMGENHWRLRANIRRRLKVMRVADLGN